MRNFYKNLELNYLYNIIEKKIRDIINKSKKSNKIQEIIDVLYDTFDKYNWIGIYLLKDNNLILGPWKGLQQTEHKTRLEFYNTTMLVLTSLWDATNVYF